MARRLCKNTISELMSNSGRKGGSRATEKQKDAARQNLKKTPNYRRHLQLVESQLPNSQELCLQKQAHRSSTHAHNDNDGLCEIDEHGPDLKGRNVKRRN